MLVEKILKTSRPRCSWCHYNKAKWNRICENKHCEHQEGEKERRKKIFQFGWPHRKGAVTMALGQFTPIIHSVRKEGFVSVWCFIPLPVPLVSGLWVPCLVLLIKNTETHMHMHVCAPTHPPTHTYRHIHIHTCMHTDTLFKIRWKSKSICNMLRKLQTYFLFNLTD